MAGKTQQRDNLQSRILGIKFSHTTAISVNVQYYSQHMQSILTDCKSRRVRVSSFLSGQCCKSSGHHSDRAVVEIVPDVASLERSRNAALLLISCLISPLSLTHHQPRTCGVECVGRKRWSYEWVCVRVVKEKKEKRDQITFTNAFYVGICPLLFELRVYDYKMYTLSKYNKSCRF